MSGINRRDVIRQVGAGLSTVSLLSGLGTAKDGQGKTFNDSYQRGLYLRDKLDWTVDEFRTYLAKQGFDFKYYGVTRTMPWPPGSASEDGPSTQELSKAHIDLEMTYTEASLKFDTPPKIDLDWHWKIPNIYESTRAEDPYDVVQIEWEDSEFDPANQPYGGTHVYEPTSVPANGSAGINMRYNDVADGKDAYSYTSDSADYVKYSSYVGSDLNYQSGDPADHDFYVRYYHTWANVDVDLSWTVGFPSVSFGTTEKQWLADAMAYQTEMDNGDSAYFDCGSSSDAC